MKPRITPLNIRDEVRAFIEGVFAADTPTLGLLSVPAGAGKTTAILRYAEANPDISLVIVVNTTAERDAIAATPGARLTAIASLDMSTCARLRAGDPTPTDVQELGHSVQDKVCSACPHRTTCASEGYLGSIRRLEGLATNPGPVRLVMTTALFLHRGTRCEPAYLRRKWSGLRDDASTDDALKKAAGKAIERNYHRIRFFVDEDIERHAIQETEISLEDLCRLRLQLERRYAEDETLTALRNAAMAAPSGSNYATAHWFTWEDNSPGQKATDHTAGPQPCYPADLFAINQLIQAGERMETYILPRDDTPGTPEEHGVAFGHEVLVSRLLPNFVPDAPLIVSMCAHQISGGTERTGAHWTEESDWGGGKLNPREPAALRPVRILNLMRACAEGACYVQRCTNGDIRFVGLSFAVQAWTPLLDAHTVIADATMDITHSTGLIRHLCSSALRRSAPRMRSCAPSIPSRIDLRWIACAPCAKVNARSTATICRVTESVRYHCGPSVGLLTRKDRVEDCRAVLEAQNLRVALVDDDEDTRQAADIIIGHYGCHDRATNAFAACSALVLGGAFRPPSAIALRRTCLDAANGWRTDNTDIHAIHRLQPGSPIPYHTNDGEVAPLDNRAICTEDWGSWRCLQRSRTAWLVQAIERIRGVTRTIDDKPVGMVVLVGVEPVLGLDQFGIPPARMMTLDEVARLPREQDATAADPITLMVQKAIAAGARTVRAILAYLKVHGVRGRGTTLQERAREGLKQAATTRVGTRPGEAAQPVEPAKLEGERVVCPELYMDYKESGHAPTPPPHTASPLFTPPPPPAAAAQPPAPAIDLGALFASLKTLLPGLYGPRRQRR